MLGRMPRYMISPEGVADEAQQRLNRYAALAHRAGEVYNRLPRDHKDAFFELGLYPVQCAALRNEKIICADKSTHYASQGRAGAAEYACKARAAEARISELTDHYNRLFLTVGKKWNNMITPDPRAASPPSSACG